MERKLFREYRFKFYLNASHSIIINGRQGEVHPHTWEFAVLILLQREDFHEFSDYERAVEQFFVRYQNRTMNDVEPFNVVIPTLENIVEYAGEALQEIIREKGGELVRIEGSETPSRSYIISYEHSSDFLSDVERNTQGSISTMLDHVLDDILDQGDKA